MRKSETRIVIDELLERLKGDPKGTPSSQAPAGYTQKEWDEVQNPLRPGEAIDTHLLAAILIALQRIEETLQSLDNKVTR